MFCKLCTNECKDGIILRAEIYNKKELSLEAEADKSQLEKSCEAVTPSKVGKILAVCSNCAATVVDEINQGAICDTDRSLTWPPVLEEKGGL